MTDGSAEGRTFLEEETEDARQAVATGVVIPHGTLGAGIMILCVLAVVFTLYLGKEIILPVVLAVMLKLLLSPAMRFLSGRWKIPEALVAILLILGVFGAVAAVGLTVARPAVGWIKKVPESLPVLKEKLSAFHGPVDFVKNGLQELQDAMTEAKQDSDASADAPSPVPGAKAEHGGVSLGMFSGIAGSVATGTATILSRFFATMIVLFFGYRESRGEIPATRLFVGTARPG